MNCPLCHDQRFTIIAGHENAVAAMCPKCECHVCENELYVFQRDAHGQMLSRPCYECGPIRERVRFYQRAGVPRRYVDATFESFKPTSQAQVQAVQWFTSRLGEWSPSERALIISGSVGTGKTHLMAAWIRSLCTLRQIECRFIEFSHLLSDLRAGYDAGQSDARIIAHLVDVPVLVIDELGKTLKTDWQLGILDALISRRYERGVATFATTNYPFELGHGGKSTRSSDDFARRTLGEVTGDRIASRLAEMCDFMTVEANDYRRTLRGPGMGARV